MIVDRINDYLSRDTLDVPKAILEQVGQLSKHAFMRQFGAKQDKSGVRLSSIGKCLRQQAYNVLDFEKKGKEIDARAKMVFFQGDLTELAIIQLAKLAGCQITACGTDQLSIDFEGVPGHPDGLLFHQGQLFLVEAKSMSSYAFGEFQRGLLDEGYRYQINSYLEGLGIDRCVVVALNKDAGVLEEMILVRSPEVVTDIIKRIGVLKVVTPQTLPERPYKPNEKGFYPWQCLYCAYWGTCLPNAERVLVGKAYKLKEKKEVPHEATAAPQN